MASRGKTDWAGLGIALLLVLAASLVDRFEAPSPEPPIATAAALPSRSNAAEAGITLDNGRYIAESYLRARIPPGQDGTLAIRLAGHHLTPMAPDLAGRYRFVNAFLVGHVPDPAVEPWVPLYTLAKRKRYQTDLAQYGKEELWQTSYEAWRNERGDCEDHALALADWLIGLGLDARVVLGKMRGEGHAWVVVRDGDRSFLLEATDKRRVRRWAYPLAELQPEYRPSDMFNRHQWWRNEAGATTDYGGGHWRMRATYEAAPAP